jgi:hypothetical protein
MRPITEVDITEVGLLGTLLGTPPRPAGVFDDRWTIDRLYNPRFDLETATDSS